MEGELVEPSHFPPALNIPVVLEVLATLVAISSFELLSLPSCSFINNPMSTSHHFGVDLLQMSTSFPRILARWYSSG
jgi:hypothetical protein